MEDLLQCMEEAFVERNFQYGDDEETSRANLDASISIFLNANKECDRYAEQIADGEMVDIPSVVLELQNLIFSHKYEESFKRELGGSGPFIDTTKIDIDEDVNELAIKGRSLISNWEEKKDFESLEKGKYLLFAAI